MKIIGNTLRMSGAVTAVIGIIMFSSDVEIFGKLLGFLVGFGLIILGAISFEFGNWMVKQWSEK